MIILGGILIGMQRAPATLQGLRRSMTEALTSISVRDLTPAQIIDTVRSSGNAILEVAGPLVAAVALNFTLGYRRRKQRLLRNGVLTRATITDLKHTNVEVNGRQRYVAFVRYKSGEEQMNESISLYGTHVDLARKVIENAEETPLLYDPKKPQNCLLGLQLTSHRIRL